MCPHFTESHEKYFAAPGALSRLDVRGARLDAYLDPGSGSMLVQLLLGGVAGAAVIIKLGWERFRDMFRRFASQRMTNQIRMSDIALEPGSFRDRTARVFYHDGKIFRGLSDTALREWQALSATAFYRRFVDSGGIVPTQQREPSPIHFAALDQQWAGVLEHEQLPFVSYPYEWSFEMLRDAALLQLDLVLAALDEGIGLKDASAYNLQWKGAAPVFVDVASFYKRADGEPWVGYRQFCQMFLYPLLVQAYRDVPFQPWMRGNIDGMDAEVCLNLLSARDYLAGRRARARVSAGESARSLQRDDAGCAGGSQQGRLRQAHHQGERRAPAVARRRPAMEAEAVDVVRLPEVRALRGVGRRAEARRSSREVAGPRDWNLAWDIGCNVGVFSRIVAERAKYVVAMDADHLAIDKLYRALKTEGVRRISFRSSST